MPTHVRESTVSMRREGVPVLSDSPFKPWLTSQAAVQSSGEVLMVAGRSWFPMVHCFYEQLEAIMDMRVLSRLEQSSPSDDRPLSLGPFPSQYKLNTNGLCSVTHIFSLHAVICTIIQTHNLHRNTIQ